MGIGPGDLVLVPSITFVASANAALYCGADVAFVDVDPTTGPHFPRRGRHLSRYLFGLLWTPRAVVAVHLAGLPCDMPALHAICGIASGLMLSKMLVTRPVRHGRPAKET